MLPRALLFLDISAFIPLSHLSIGFCVANVEVYFFTIFERVFKFPCACDLILFCPFLIGGPPTVLTSGPPPEIVGLCICIFLRFF